MIELQVTCDHADCETSAVIAVAGGDLPRGAEQMDVTVEGFGPDSRVGFMLTVDMGWVDAPDGWTLAEDGEYRCRFHAEADDGDG